MRLALFVSMIVLPAAALAGIPQAHEFEFVYRIEITSTPNGGPLEVFLPLAVSDEHQEVSPPVLKGPLKLKEGREKRYGNRFLHGTLDGRIAPGHQDPFVIEARYKVKRRLHRNPPGHGGEAPGTERANPTETSLFLQPDRRVPSNGRLVEKMIADLAFKPSEDKAARAKRIYDFVVDTMEYKKAGKGWGNGDTEWACTQKYGNCTDFHALFSSLARHEGIPSRFEIGFPVPMDKPEGEIGGYHCWVNFYLPGKGWVPIDASEAKKDLSKRELYFGTHPPDRVKFSVGRDIVLSPKQKSPPLNYFVYPHVEYKGAKYEGVKTSFSFRKL